jgi:hypothetical protein
MKKVLCLLLCTGTALAQSITIPSQTVVTPVTINGTTVQISITIPAQTVTLPTSTAGLPSGMTYSSTAGLSVTGPIVSTGSISATTLSLTSGPTLPTSTSGMYVWELTGGLLEPVPYIPYVLPPLTVASSAANTITLTP